MTTQINAPSELEIKEARRKLWYMGELQWKMDVTQMKIYDFFHTKTDKLIVVNCSRRLGKTYFLLIMAIEQCLKNPKSIVKFIQPEQKMLRTNLRPVMGKIFEDCPDDLRPQFKTQDSVYRFPNGSEIQLAGTDNGNHEKLRGSDSHLCIIDEAGFCSDLNYIIESILTPTTTLTGGRIVLSSTTPPNPEHEFIKCMDLAELEDRIIVKTIDDAVEDHKAEMVPRITAEIVEDIIKALPNGRDSQTFKTEYLCKRMMDSDNSVVPEFNEETMKDIVAEWPRPPFANRYVSMDIGFTDLTVVLFAYYDFQNAVTVIEDEIVINGPKMTTNYLAELIRKKEVHLWTDQLTAEVYKPRLRVSDNNMIVINDLQKLHGLHFIPTLKDNRDMQINNLRMEIASGGVKIHPRCTTLIQHLLKGTWNKQRTDLARSADNGHFDAIMAAVYLLRNIDKNSNPYPRGYRYKHMTDNYNDLFFSPHFQEDDGGIYSKLNDQFKPKSSLSKFKKK